MPAQGLKALSPIVVGAGYFAIYLAFDLASYVQPLGPFAITPWNPGAGLSIALILLCGRRYLPLLFFAPFAAESINRQVPATLTVYLAICAVMGVAYSAAATLLQSPRLRFDARFTTMRDLFVLMMVAMSAAAITAVAVVALLFSSGLMLRDELVAAALTYWVGDVIAVAVMTPFLLVLGSRPHLLRPDWETGAHAASIALALAVVFARPLGPQMQLFYLMFLPIIWIALRKGMEGVTAGLVLTQCGLMGAVQLSPLEDIDVTAFQFLMLVLSFTGLVSGMLVTERRRAEISLRQQQEEQSRIARLGSLGELATSIAHEINQPLMAAGTYTRLVGSNLDAKSGDLDLARQAAGKAVVQLDRAADVVRSLRNLVRLGRSTSAPARVPDLVSTAIDLVRPALGERRVLIRQSLPSTLPPVMVDALQIEQVLINLLRNAYEAIVDGSTPAGAIDIIASAGPDEVEIVIADNGPGFTREQIESLGKPFTTSKPDGLGIGLALSRTIVEAHGGRLWAMPAQRGARLHMTLPLARTQA